MHKKVTKLLFISTNILSSPSASNICVTEMCNAFAKNGYATTLMVLYSSWSPNKLFAHYNIDYPFDVLEIRMPRVLINNIIPGLNTFFGAFSLIKGRKIQAELILTRNPWVFFIYAFLCRKRCIFDSHQFRFIGKIQTSIYRKMIRYATCPGRGKMVCISNRLKTQWLQTGIDASKIFVAHDAVNLKKFNNSISKEKARAHLNLPSDRSLVVYTGSLLPGKGVDILIKSANRLPEVYFVIVGGHEDQIRSLKTMVQHNNVIFSGFVNPRKVSIFQSAADILALPNSKGSVIDDVTSPMKLFEYMASGRPIVATDVPSVLEILKHEYNALISPMGDDEHLSQNIILLLHNAPLSQRLVNNNKHDLSKYSWDARIQHFIKVFKLSNYLSTLGK
jgi:glycosyltransferase involved in cell wall biosynthesis